MRNDPKCRNYVVHEAPGVIRMPAYTLNRFSFDKYLRQIVGEHRVEMIQTVFVKTSWGGTKGSGIGRELGPWGLAAYQSVKHVTRCLSRCG